MNPIQLSPFPENSALNPQQGGTGFDATTQLAGYVLVTTGNPQSAFELELLPVVPPPTIKGVAIFKECYPNGTAGPAGTASQYNPRLLNTTFTNGIGASVNTANGIVTIPAGTYRISASAVSSGFETTQCDIRTFAGPYLDTGVSVAVQGSASQNSLLSTCETWVESATPIEIYINQWCGPLISGDTGLLGSPASAGSFPGQVETYATLYIQQL